LVLLTLLLHQFFVMLSVLVMDQLAQTPPLPKHLAQQRLLPQTSTPERNTGPVNILRFLTIDREGKNEAFGGMKHEA
jgi:hypothetical protein